MDRFCLFVGVNPALSWENEGWWFIICEQGDFVPYIAETLSKLKQQDIKEAFEAVIQTFPDFTVFKADDEAYIDIVNFYRTLDFVSKMKG